MGAQKKARKAETARQAGLLESAEAKPVPELYFATVRAIGTPIDPVENALDRSLRDATWSLETVRLSKALDRKKVLPVEDRKKSGESKFDRYQRLNAAAVNLRRRTLMRDAVARAGIERLHRKSRVRAKKRARAAGSKGVAFLFRNLMHHEEVGRLRKLYDRQLFVISVYSSQEDREDNLAQNLGPGHRRGGDPLRDRAKKLVAREAEFFRRNRQYERETATQRKYVTNIPKAFQYGDLFVDAADPGIARQIDRFVDLIFGQPFFTPTRDEIGMSDAFSSALQSGNLARQVGAAICSDDGDLLATGTNDVPKAGGGVYRSDEGADDYRDHNESPRLRQFRRGFDVSDTTRRSILHDLVHRVLADPGWLEEVDALVGSTAGAELAAALEVKPHRHDKLEPIIEKLINSDLIWGAQFFDMLEYGRTMHAEMDAITSAARKGVSVRGATLYCTTLPCHECARLIIGAGIRRVIYIEPYEKSRSEMLFDSEIRFTTLARSRQGGQVDGRQYVDFVPYVGISPRRFAELFAKGDRKLDDQPAVGEDSKRTLSGMRAAWDKAEGRVRESVISKSSIESERRLADVLDHELQLIDELHERLDGQGDGDEAGES